MELEVGNMNHLFPHTHSRTPFINKTNTISFSPKLHHIKLLKKEIISVCNWNLIAIITLSVPEAPHQSSFTHLKSIVPQFCVSRALELQCQFWGKELVAISESRTSVKASFSRWVLRLV
jgi:hypothetical protein